MTRRRKRAVGTGGRAAGALQWAELFRVVHILPGRVRLRFRSLKDRPAVAAALESHLGAVEGISRVEVNPLTGSLLVHYDPRRLRSPELLHALSSALGKVFPGRFAPGRLHLRVRQLRGNPELAAAVTERLAPLPGIERLEIDPATGDCLLVYDPREVTKQAFVDRLAGSLGELLPGLDLKALAARAGLRSR
jgi:copper chaperone CopZ